MDNLIILLRQLIDNDGKKNCAAVFIHGMWNMKCGNSMGHLGMEFDNEARRHIRRFMEDDLV